jgi:FkbM family methyltransferase
MIQLNNQKLYDFINTDILDELIKIIRKRNRRVEINGHSFRICTPNALCKYRAKTFATKEPETIKWIDSFNKNALLWDIGANIGLYSMYAAKVKNCSVLSFEPSIFNLETLARNIYLNDLCDKITTMPFPLNNNSQSGILNLSSDNWGGALSSFDKTYGSDGLQMEFVFKYSVYGISMDDLVERLDFKTPDYIKVDVDGIEELILKGGLEALKSVKSILIELPGLNKEQTFACETILKSSGLKKIHESNWHPINNPTGSQNQIWER